MRICIMKIYFFNSNSIEMQMYYAEKEYRDDVMVEINGMFYEVYFFTKDALEYEMTLDGFFSFPGMIILDSISTEIIIDSLLKLYKKNFFDSFKGMKNLNSKKRFVNNWYSNKYSEYNMENITMIEI